MPRMTTTAFALVLAALVFGSGWALAQSATSPAPAKAKDAVAETGPFKGYAQTVIATLKSKGLTGVCPMCGKNDWVVHEVPLALPVYDPDGRATFPKSTMPAAAMVCRNCGFISLHSLGALGLIPKDPAKSEPHIETK